MKLPHINQTSRRVVVSESTTTYKHMKLLKLEFQRVTFSL